MKGKLAVRALLGAVLLTVIPVSASAQTSSDFCVDDSGFINRFASRLGWIELNRQHELAPMIECLVGLDDTNNAELGEFMPRMYVALLRSDPRTFVHVMAQHPAALGHWLRDLDQAFVWSGDPPSPMEDERQRLILLVQAAEVDPADAPVKAQILRRLREVRPRVID